MIDTVVARWSINSDGDVVESITDHPDVIWHTGNAETAKALIAERKEMVEKVYLRHLRQSLDHIRALR